MRVERGSRAVLRLEVEGRPAQTYSRPGRTTRRMASRTAGATIQGRKRRRLLGAMARPQPEQYRLSGLSASPQSGQNELVRLTGYIILRGSQSPPPCPPQRGRGSGDAGAQDSLEVGQCPALDLVTGVARPIERLDRRGGDQDPVVAVAQVGDGMQHADVGAHPDHRDLLGARGAQPRLEVGLKETGVAALADQRGLLEQRLELGD